ncbi:MAG: translation elongation factor 4 [Eubacteriales bacterium]|nr:translation elongation factor 4 [Clostridia bacterium]MDY5753725.1 translation elongation factor 4 [Eubacteriales bacterium]
MAYSEELIRNFCIIAHIDHGKSTLADRMMELTGTIAERDMEDQLLDTMDIERERGITIKATAVRMFYKHSNGKTYMFNLIDTPGHVDFTYEVSRSLAACDGAILVVDATQGIEAQTLANVYLALDNDLEIMPVVNKIDLPSAQPEVVIHEIEDVIGLPAEDAPRISAKLGTGVSEVLERLVDTIPAPHGDVDAPLKALIFDSYYDNYKGALSYVRVFDGVVRAGSRIRSMATGKEYDVTEVGVFTPSLKSTDELSAGEVGYIAASIKSVRDTKVGDTLTDALNPTVKPLPGYKHAQPMVYCGIYPADGAEYEDLRDALEKLMLNDASLSFEPETSQALGFGFRCGFLGLLHMEIIQERLEREFDLDLVTTSPSVVYRVTTTAGEVLTIDNPSNLPNPAMIASMEEPMVEAHIMVPDEFVGAIMDLCQSRRGIFRNMTYIEKTRASLTYELPLNEIIYDFFDQLKSRSRGYASFDYELKEYVKSDLVKLDFLLNGDMCDALSTIVHAERAYAKGRAVAEKLKDVIPRQQFEIPIQAAIGGKIIARETVRAVRKDVLAKCYGGDITRKKKLLEKQKEGKKRMRQIGSVTLPSEAFMSVLRIN